MNVQKNAYPPYPEYPYSPPFKGLFHNQIPVDSDTPGKYSVYIPDNFEHCSPGVMILVPDETSAQAFLEGETGQSWVNVSDAYGIAIIVVEPHEARVWNLHNVVSMRDDDAFFRSVYASIRDIDTPRDESESTQAVLNMDERGFYLVGYNQGGSAAHKIAMLWPQLVCGLASVNGGIVFEKVIAYYSRRLAPPFLQAKVSDGLETLGLPGGNIPVPVWMIASTDAAASSEAVKSHWITAAKAVEGVANEYAREVYENGSSRIWVTEGETISPRTIYSEFLSQVQRFPSEPGGDLRWTVRAVNQKGKGFFSTETEVDGRIRRWLTYVPSSYDGGKAYPLVIGFHGGTNRGINFAGDSEWHEAAEKYGFLVVYPTAYPSTASSTLIPIPIWNQYVIAPPHDPSDDVAFVKEVIARTRQNYNVDAGRIYASGHSSGGAMSWRLGIDAPGLFAAISPNGVIYGAWPPADNATSPQIPSPGKGLWQLGKDASEPFAAISPLEAPLPVWVCMGQYDYFEADAFFPGNPNDLMLKYWSVYDSFEPNVLTASYEDSGRYYIRTWTNGSGIPIFNYMTMHHCTHVHRPSACDLIWREFFSKFSLDANGKRYYNGQEIFGG